MVLGIGFGTIVLSALWLSTTLHPLAALPGLGLAGAAAAWLGGGPRLFGKSADGHIPRWAYVLHWGWYGLAALSFHGRLALSGERACDEVAPGVWVGRRLLGPEQARLPSPDAAVLDLTAELPATVRGGAYRCLPVLDGLGPRPAQLREAARWIQAQRAAGRVVYVHCAMGHGRSASVVAAWMMAEEPGLTAEQAEARMRQRRPGVRLTGAQHRALRQVWQAPATER